MDVDGDGVRVLCGGGVGDGFDFRRGGEVGWVERGLGFLLKALFA